MGGRGGSRDADLLNAGVGTTILSEAAASTPGALRRAAKLRTGRPTAHFSWRVYPVRR